METILGIIITTIIVIIGAFISNKLCTHKNAPIVFFIGGMSVALSIVILNILEGYFK